MSDRPDGRVIAIGALGVAPCCALPVLVGSGFLASLAGLGSGSGLLVGAGLVLAGLVGFRQWRRRTGAMPADEARDRRAQPH